MKKILTLFAGSCMTAMSVIYIVSILSGETKPRLATWLIFVVACAMSLGSYLKAGNHSLLDNINNTLDTIGVVVISFVIIGVYGLQELRFEWFDGVCMGFAFLVGIFWFQTKEAEISNKLIQIIMTIAYFPTLYKLWIAETNTEVLFPWILGFSGSFSAFLVAKLAKNKLAMLYAGRAAVLTATVIILILV